MAGRSLAFLAFTLLVLPSVAPSAAAETSPYDIQVQVVLDPAYPVADAPTTVTLTITNLGPGDAPNATLLSYVDDVGGFESLGTLPAGESVMRSFTQAFDGGSHYISATAWAEGSDTDYSNDYAYAYFVATTGPEADLAVESPWVADAYVGQYTSMGAAVYNLGESDAPDAEYLVTIANAAQTVVHSSYISFGPIAARAGTGTGSSFMFQEAGDYNVTFAVWTNATENRADNNAISVPVHVSAAQPDLVLEDAYVASWPTESEPVDLDVRLANRGGADAGPSTLRLTVLDAFTYEVVSISDQPTPALEAGGVLATTFSLGTFPAGEYYVWVEADFYEEVDESDEYNNDAEADFDVEAAYGPDGAVTDLWSDGDATRAFHARVENYGDQAAEATVSFAVYDGNGWAFLEQTFLGTLPPGGVAFVDTTTYTFPPGDYVVEAYVTMDGDADAMNDKMSMGFSVAGGGSDLVVSQFYHAPDPATESDPVTLFAEVTNVGSAFASSWTSVGFYVHYNGTTQQIREESVPPLAAGQSYFIEIPVGFVERGTYDLSAQADIYGTEAESDEMNNIRMHVLVVDGGSSEMPNLVAGAYVAPAAPGQAVVLEAYSANRGNAAAGPFTLEVYLDGMHQGSVGYGGLDANRTTFDGFGWTATPGFHELTVVVDAYGEVHESDENDNVATFTFYVEEVPVREADLAVALLGVNKAPVRTDFGEARPNPLGRQLVDVQVCNLGEEELAPSTVSVDAEASAPALETPTFEHIGSIDVPPLQGGECKALRFVWDSAGTVGDVEIVARGWAQGPEASYANNDARTDSFVLVGGFGGVIASP